jgi:hypothetical protein
MRFSCKTLFDITVTGVTGHYNSSRISFIDLSGKQIENKIAWNRSRNQQRNWETLTQLIGLRTQISKLDLPLRSEMSWIFEFEVENPYVFGTDENPTELLLADCNGVPMLIQLENIKNLDPFIVIEGINQNIWFNRIN